MKLITPDGAQLNVPPASLRPASWNPRRERNQAGLDALAASVRDVGILQPLVVREAAEGLEVVCGHRRLAAALAAGLEEIPVILRHLNDQAAYSLAVTENLQREDLTEIDEAEAYQELLRAGLTVDEVAAKAGRSKSHVYLRLKLLELPEAAQEALRDGRLTVAIAALIGRIPGAREREAATAKVLDGGHVVEWRHPDDGGPIREPMSYQAARKLLVEGYMLTLEAAPFDVNDAALVPAAGACSACRHRSGNQTDLFGDVVAEGGADVCTYPPCYQGKVEAHAAALCAGVDLPRVSAKEAEKCFAGGSRVGWNSKYVDADAPHANGATGKKPIRKALGDAAPKEFVAVDGTGALRRMYRKKDVDAALRSLAPEVSTGPSPQAASDSERRLDDAALEIIEGVIDERCEDGRLDSARLLRLLAALQMADTRDEERTFTTILRSLKPVATEVLVAMLARRTIKGLARDEINEWSDYEGAWAEAAKIYGVTIDSALKQAAAEIAAADAVPVAPAGAPEPACDAPKSAGKRPAAKPKKKAVKKVVKKTAKKARPKK